MYRHIAVSTIKSLSPGKITYFLFCQCAGRSSTSTIAGEVPVAQQDPGTKKQETKEKPDDGKGRAGRSPSVYYSPSKTKKDKKGSQPKRSAAKSAVAPPKPKDEQLEVTPKAALTEQASAVAAALNRSNTAETPPVTAPKGTGGGNSGGGKPEGASDTSDESLLSMSVMNQKKVHVLMSMDQH